MTKKYKFLWITLIFLLVAAACSSGSENNPAATEDGKTLFNKSVLGSAAGCSTCHSIEPGTIIVGPSLAGIATAAGQRQEGQSAEDYLRQSIMEPDAYLVEGFPKSVMPQRYGTELSEEEINNLVSYMLTLK